MSLLRIIEYLRSQQRMLTRIAVAALILLVLADALPFIVDKSAAHTAAERLPGFWALYGLAGAFLLVFVAKGLARMGIQQPEDASDD